MHAAFSPKCEFFAPERNILSSTRIFLVPKWTFFVWKRALLAQKRKHFVSKRIFLAQVRWFLAWKRSFLVPKRTHFASKRTFLPRGADLLRDFRGRRKAIIEPFLKGRVSQTTRA